MWSKLFLIIEVLILILIAIIIWYYDYHGIQLVIIICIIAFSIVITGLILIKNWKRKSRNKPNRNIEDSCESMLGPTVTNVNRRNNRRYNTLSDQTAGQTVLQQSDFLPQTVSAIIENTDKIRDSVISDNEVPPTYEEAKYLPKL